MKKLSSFLLQVAAAAATLLAVGVAIHPVGMIFTAPVVIASLVVGFMITATMAVLASSGSGSLRGSIGAGAVTGVVIWVILAWVSFYLTGHFPGGSMLSGDFLGRAVSVAAAGVAAAFVQRHMK